MKDPATHGGGDAVQVIETHISRIFLVGDRALKMKRAARLPYADFSTAEQRLQVCEKELALNAPGCRRRLCHLPARIDGDSGARAGIGVDRFGALPAQRGPVGRVPATRQGKAMLS
ncbi:MAG: hypothetical protein WCZ18_03640 [Ottowia sp.]|nr:hypothetical protein [Ottowia sp.]